MECRLTIKALSTKIAGMDKKTVLFAAIFLLLLAGCAAAWFVIGRADTGTEAVITVDGEVYKTVDLSKVKTAYDIEIDTEYGHNTVHVEPGAISVSEADCPDGICVRQGKISTGGVPIICMPHRLSIAISGGDIDA